MDRLDEQARELTELKGVTRFRLSDKMCERFLTLSSAICSSGDDSISSLCHSQRELIKKALDRSDGRFSQVRLDQAPRGFPSQCFPAVFQQDASSLLCGSNDRNP